MKDKFVNSLKEKQTRIVICLIIALLFSVCFFSVARAFFRDQDSSTSSFTLGGAVEITLEGTGENGKMQNFSTLYDSGTKALPGDKILDSISVRLEENSPASIIRAKFYIAIMYQDEQTLELLPKTQNFTQREEELLLLLQNELNQKTTLYSNDWSEQGDWIYYNSLIDGLTNPVQMFDEYFLPLWTTTSDYQDMYFQIKLNVEAIQAANIIDFAEWMDDIVALENPLLFENIINYNAERINGVGEGLAYLELTGTQHIDTKLNSGLATMAASTPNYTVSTIPSSITVPASNFDAFHNGVKGKLKNIRIKDGEGVVRDFYPVLDLQGVPCWFDMKTKELYYNNGSPAFGYTHSISYILCGGQNDSRNPTSFLPSNLPLELYNPSRAEHSFEGWYTSSNYSGTAVCSIPAEAKSSVVLYAKWSKLNSINYHLNGGENAADAPTFYKTGEGSTLPTPTRTGYSFGGWYTSQALTGDAITSISTTQQGAVDLWAKWTEDSYTITYNLNGGTNSEENVSSYGISTAPVKLYSPTNGDKAFLGWFENASFTGERVSVITKNNLKNYTIYARWGTPYTITYNVDGGVNSGANPQTFFGDVDIDLYAPTKANHQFLGWFTTSNFSGSAVTEIPAGTSANVTLYAKWEDLTRTITYVLYDGSNNPKNPDTFVTGGNNITLHSPSKVGHTFEGWYDNSGFTGEALTTIAGSTTTNITLYAKWTANIYRVSLETNGSNELSQYVMLDYIQSTGAQYIDSGVAAADDVGVNIDFAKLNTADTIAVGSCGTGDARLAVNPSSNRVNVSWNNFLSSSNISLNTKINATVNFCNNRKRTVNDILEANITQTLNNNPYNLCIFAGYWRSSTPSLYATIKLYGLKISKGTEIVRNYIPVQRKSDGEIGLYDLISNTFYPNLASGADFIGGEEVGDVFNGLVTYNSTYTLPTLTKAGEYFVGWYKNPDFTGAKQTEVSGLTQDITLYARFSSSQLVYDEISPGLYKVSAANTSITGEIDIPETYYGGTVVAIAESGFANCKNITKVNIPSSVKLIQENAFAGTTNLTVIAFDMTQMPTVVGDPFKNTNASLEFIFD